MCIRDSEIAKANNTNMYLYKEQKGKYIQRAIQGGCVHLAGTASFYVVYSDGVIMVLVCNEMALQWPLAYPLCNLSHYCTILVHTF